MSGHEQQAIPVRCPYCENFRFDIENPTAEGTFPEEIEVLPYARDVDIFNPEDHQTNSAWTEVGEGFLLLCWPELGGRRYTTYGDRLARPILRSSLP